jgi:hypothetical protein
MNKLIELMQKHFFLVGYVFIFGYIAVASFDRISDELESDPLTISASNKTELFSVKSGDAFEFWRDVCVYSDMVIRVHREFYNVDTSNRYMMPSISYGAKKDDGCFEVRFFTDVPQNIDPGSYLYRPVLIYSVNQNKTIAKEAPPVEVEVIE